MQNQIPENWQKVRLGDLLEGVVDNRGKTPPLLKTGYPMIEVYQLSRDSKYPNVNYDSKQKYVSESTYVEWFRAGHPKSSDLLISTVGTISLWNLVPEGPRYCIAQNVVALRPNQKKTSAEFLRQYFNQKSFVGQVQGIAIGAAQPSVRLPHFLNLELDIPKSKTEQDKITSVLTVFDDKIEINNKIAKTLEEMAQAIFKEWFISETGKGWGIKRISDIAKINKGVSYSSKEINEGSKGLPMLNLANFQRGGGFNPSGVKFYTGKYKGTNLVKPGGIVIAMTDLTSNREVIGHPARVPSYGDWKEILISLDVCSIETEEIYTEFLYYLMLRKDFSYLMASSAGGTNVSHLAPKFIEGYEFMLPDKDILKKFQNVVTPIFEKTNLVESENQNLIKMRDLLLPKLMKGEIRV